MGKTIAWNLVSDVTIRLTIIKSIQHDKTHPKELGAQDVEVFLSHLAVERSVSASTQNQAKSALLFLYREVLEMQLPWLDNITQAKAPKRLPTVLARAQLSHRL